MFGGLIYSLHIYIMKSLSLFNFSVKNAIGSNTCDVFIDGLIVDESTRQFYSDWLNDTTSLSYKSCRESMSSFINSGCTEFNVYINSLGGNVVEAMALHDYFIELEDKGIKINRIGRGIIASASTYILCGIGSKITKNSWFMIHNVSGGVEGDVAEVESYAKSLRKFNDMVATFYSNCTGIDKTEIEKMMSEETFMTGEDAVALGFVEGLIDEEVPFTNAIDPKKWTFNNKAVVVAYNSYTKINPNMDTNTITNIVNGAKTAFIDALKQAKLLPSEDSQMETTLTNALNSAFEPLNSGITELVEERVGEKMAELNTALGSMVANEVSKLNVVDNSAQITEFENRIKDIEEKLTGGAGSAHQEFTPNEPKTALNHTGIKW